MPVSPFIHISVKGLSGIDTTIKGFSRRFPELAARALYTAVMARFIPPLQDRIKKQKNIFEGQLFQRIGARAIITSTGQAAVDCGVFGVAHAMAVEEGQPPGVEQDLAKLQRYARLKLGYSPKRALRIGALLKKSIETRGSKAYHPIMRTWRTRAGLVRADFEARMRIVIAGIRP